MSDRLVNVAVWCLALAYLGGRIQASRAAGAGVAGDVFLAALVGLLIVAMAADSGRAPARADDEANRSL